MEFDKSKVYTLVNADEVKIGSKGYFAGTLAELKANVRAERDGYLGRYFGTVKFIDPESKDCRFIREDDKGRWGLFYLVEEPEEKGFRPYKDTDEMIDHFCRHFNLIPLEHRPPQIWIKHKDTQSVALITSFSKINNAVTFASSDIPHSLGILFEQYTYFDGSPCGIEEE